jgi:hypothetical protein
MWEELREAWELLEQQGTEVKYWYVMRAQVLRMRLELTARNENLFKNSRGEPMWKELSFQAANFM